MIRTYNSYDANKLNIAEGHPKFIKDRVVLGHSQTASISNPFQVEYRIGKRVYITKRTFLGYRKTHDSHLPT